MLDKYYQKAMEDAKESLLNDGVIILPTDTVYGLATLSSSKKGIEKIYKMKGRDKEKLLPLIVNSFEMAKRVIDIDISILEKLNRYFPGALTIVAKRNPSFDYYDAPTIAIRMIDIPLVNEIISLVNEPLALTSANLSNEKEISDPVKLIDTFEGYVDCVFVGGKMSDVPSTIVRINDDNSLTLLREGKIPFSDILKEYNHD